MILAVLTMAGCLALFFTAGYWIPSAAQWIAERQAGIRVEMDAVDFFPLKRITILNFRVGRAGADTDAIVVRRKEITYKDFSELLRGHLTSLQMEGVEIYEPEIFATRRQIRESRRFPKEMPSHLTGNIYRFIEKWSPEQLHIRALNWKRASEKTYGCARLAATRSETPEGEIVLNLSLETEPLERMDLPLAMRGPLRLDGGFALTPETFRVLRLETNLDNLMEMRVAEEGTRVETSGGFLNLAGTEADLDAWLKACGVSVPGDLESRLRIHSLGFARETDAGETLGAWKINGDFGLYIEKWADFHPCWNIRAAEDRLTADAAVSLDFQKLGWQSAHAARVEMLQTPWGIFEDLKLETDIEATWDKERLEWTQQLTFSGPRASETAPAEPRLNLDGRMKTIFLPTTSEIHADFDFQNQISRGQNPPFEISTAGQLDYRPDIQTREAQLALVAGGDLSGSPFQIEASGAFGSTGFPSGTACVELSRFSLEETERAAGLLNIPFRIDLRGVSDTRVSARWDAQGRGDTSATLRVEGFSIGPRGKASFLNGPVDLEATLHAAAGPTPEDPIEVYRSVFEADGNVWSEGKGTLQFLPGRFVSRFEPTLRIESLQRLGDRIRVPMPLEAAAELEGSAGIETDYRAFLAHFDGAMALNDARSVVQGFPVAAGRADWQGRINLNQKPGAYQVSLEGRAAFQNLETSDNPSAESDGFRIGELEIGTAAMEGKASVESDFAGRRFALDGLFHLKNLRRDTREFSVSIEKTSFTLSLSGGTPPETGDRTQTGIRFDIPPTQIAFLPRFGAPDKPSTETLIILDCAGSVVFGPSPDGLPETIYATVEMDRFSIGLPDGAKLEIMDRMTWEGTIGAGGSLAFTQMFDLQALNLPALLEQLHKSGTPGVAYVLNPAGVRITTGDFRIRRERQSFDRNALVLTSALEPDMIGGDVLNEMIVWDGLSGLLDVALTLPNPFAGLSPQALDRLTARSSGTLYALELMTCGADFRELAIQMRSENRKIFFDDVAFKAYGGEGTLTANVDLESSPTAFAVQATIRQMDLGVLAREHPALKDVRMSGTVDVEAEWRRTGEETSGHAQITQISPQIYIDRVTSYKILVDNLKKIGLGGKVKDAEAVFRKKYLNVNMIGFEEFGLGIRYSSQDDTVRNTFRLRSSDLGGYTYDVNYRIGDVMRIMRLWQNLQLEARRLARE